MEKKNWQGKTGGGNFGQKSMFFLLKYGGINIAYVIVAIVSFFYFLVKGSSTKNIYRYFRDRNQCTVFHSLLNTYRNNFLFAKTLIDKFAIFAGRRDEYAIEEIGADVFTDAINNSQEGAIILNSHVGCAEIAGYILFQNKKKMNALVYGGESPAMQEYRGKILKAQNVFMIPVTDGFSHIFGVNEALKKAELVSMHGDRTYEGSRNQICNFLGAPAQFPIGPFQIAVKFKVPILVLFVMQVGYKKYKSYVIKVDVESLSDYKEKQQVELLVNKYVSLLEDIVKQYPLQWYNFHKFWL